MYAKRLLLILLLVSVVAILCGCAAPVEAFDVAQRMLSYDRERARFGGTPANCEVVSPITNHVIWPETGLVGYVEIKETDLHDSISPFYEEIYTVLPAGIYRVDTYNGHWGKWVLFKGSYVHLMTDWQSDFGWIHNDAIVNWCKPVNP